MLGHDRDREHLSAEEDDLHHEADLDLHATGKYRVMPWFYLPNHNIHKLMICDKTGLPHRPLPKNLGKSLAISENSGKVWKISEIRRS